MVCVHVCVAEWGLGSIFVYCGSVCMCVGKWELGCIHVYCGGDVYVCGHLGVYLCIVVVYVCVCGFVEAEMNGRGGMHICALW